MTSVFRSSIFVVVALMLAAPAMADIWDETANGGGDAGDFPTGSFQSANDSFSYVEITGVLMGIDVDAYCLTINSATWSMEVVGGTETDTRLWLFDLNGNFLMGNDDSSQIGGALQSLLTNTASFPIGEDGLVDSPTDPSVGQNVILVINGFADDALDSNGDLLTNMNSNFSALVGIAPASTGVFGSWEGVDQGGGTYDIVLTGATLTNTGAVPEPTAIGLLAFGLIGYTVRRRRK